MTQTAQVETFGNYKIIIETAEGYTAEDGILTVSIWHTKSGLVDSHTDGMTLRNARDNAKYKIKRQLESTASFYMGFDEVELLGLHNDLILLKDSTDYIVSNQTALIYARFKKYSAIRDYVMNKAYKGFSPYFNKNDIHHAEELI